MSLREGARALLYLLQAMLLVAGVCLAFWGFFMATNEILFHGFAPNCSDGSPEYDPRYCGITWEPGLPYVAAVLGGLIAVTVAVWHRLFTGVLWIALGLSWATAALLFLWGYSWNTPNPPYAEPAAPQLLMLGVGLVGAAGGLVCLIVTRPDAPASSIRPAGPDPRSARAE